LPVSLISVTVRAIIDDLYRKTCFVGQFFVWRNYHDIDKLLRDMKYAVCVDSEHGTSSTREHAIAVMKALAAER